MTVSINDVVRVTEAIGNIIIAPSCASLLEFKQIIILAATTKSVSAILYYIK
jgi:hypothetical protein